MIPQTTLPTYTNDMPIKEYTALYFHPRRADAVRLCLRRLPSGNWLVLRTLNGETECEQIFLTFRHAWHTYRRWHRLVTSAGFYSFRAAWAEALIILVALGVLARLLFCIL